MAWHVIGTRRYFYQSELSCQAAHVAKQCGALRREWYMAWHVIGTRRYFYHSERVNGKPVRRYIGKGKAGEVAAEIADLRRLEREIKARELMAEENRLKQAEAHLTELCEMTDMLVRAALIAAGYHQHDRGDWRRRHGTNPTTAS